MQTSILRHYVKYLLLLILYKSSFAQVVPKTNTTDLYNSCHNTWLGFAKKGIWDSALFYGNKLEKITIQEHGDVTLEHAIVLSNVLGKTFDAAGDIPAACYAFKKSIHIFHSVHDTSSEEYIYALYAVGIESAQINASNDAENYLTKAAQIFWSKKNDTTNESVKLMNYCQCILVLANIYNDQGNYTKAQLIYMTITEILDSLPKNSYANFILASAYNNLGKIYFQLGNEKKSLNCFRMANVVGLGARNLPYNQNKDILLNLAHAYSLWGETDSALLMCNQIETGLKIQFNSTLFVNLLKEKAFIYQRQNKIKEAILLQTEYKKISDSLKIKPDAYDATLINLGSLYNKDKQFASAETLFRKEDKSLRKAGLLYSYEEQQAMLGLCATLINETNYNEALDSLILLCHVAFTSLDKNFFGMSEEEKLKYKNGLDEIFNLLYISLSNINAITNNKLLEIYKLELQRNNLVLLDEANLFSRIRNSKDTTIYSIYTNWLNNKKILSKQYSLPVSQRIFNADSLSNVCEKLEKKLSEKEYLLTKATQPESYSEALNKVKLSAANIQFLSFNYKTENNEDSVLYAAFVIKNIDSTISFVHLCSEKMIIKLMQNKKGILLDENQLTEKLYKSHSKSAASLYHLLWKPFLPYLKSVKNINYTASGIINNIAIQAIFDGKYYLTYKYTFHRYFNLKDTEKEPDEYQHPHSISIWGNMNYDSAVYNKSPFQDNKQIFVGPIPITEQGLKSTGQNKYISSSPLQSFDTTEISQLKKLFTVHHIPFICYQDGIATEEAFKETASLINGVLHISTHGFYTPLDNTKYNASLPGTFVSGIINPLFRCGLAFSGANYYWIKGMARSNREDGILTGYEVMQLDLHNVKLLTLSACETGLGDVTGNEGTLGLQRAFKLAGVQNMLVSLWQVPAKQTAELLSLFYSNWLHGQIMSVALQNAENKMQKRGYPPYYWAGFILIE